MTMNVIPFFRYTDAEPVAPEDGYSVPLNTATEADAALANNYYLSDDQYGATTELSLDATTLPLQNVPVGRLVDTPTDIAGIIEDYLANSTITPSSTLATGYSFMEPAAETIAGDFAAVSGEKPDTLLDVVQNGVDENPWTAAQLQSPAADPAPAGLPGGALQRKRCRGRRRTALWTSQLSLGTNLHNALVISAGCHSGYAVDPDDAVTEASLPSWPEEFASAGATLIAGTGYQYGDRTTPPTATSTMSISPGSSRPVRFRWATRCCNPSTSTWRTSMASTASRRSPPRDHAVRHPDAQRGTHGRRSELRAAVDAQRV